MVMWVAQGSMEPRGGNFERIEDANRVSEIMGALARHTARGVLESRGQRTRTRVLSSCERERVVTWELGEPAFSSPVRAEIVGFNSVFRVPIEGGARDGQHFHTAYPQHLEVHRRRWQRRAAAARTLAATVTLDGERMLAEVRDLSYEGLALTLPRVGVAVGGALDVELDDGVRVSALRCEVRAVSPTLDGKIVVGLRVLATLGRQPFINLVTRALHPHTETGSHLCGAVWALYRRCGYFELSGKQPEEFAQRQAAFESVSRQLDHAPHIGVQVHWPTADGRDVVGALSGLKVYSGTWIGLQLAKEHGDGADGASSRDVLRELCCHVFEHWQIDPEFRWFSCHVQTKQTWTRFVIHDGLQRFGATGEAAFIRQTALEASVDTPFGDGSGEFEIDAADFGEQAELGRHIAETRPAAYADALDLTPARFDLAANRRAWNGARLERDRAVVVARKDGRAVAAAVFESAADGLHLFGLLDLVRFYVLAPAGAAAFDALLDAARAWFAERDKTRFCLFAERDIVLAPETRAKMVDLGETDFVLLAARRLPDLLEVIYERTAPRGA